MADLTQNYIKWIGGFTKDQFDDIVYTYIKNVWKINELVITDGTNDGGNDFRIFEDTRKLKIQIQATIQETGIEGKIIKEINNAARNVSTYGYQNKLFFFYSYSISEEKNNEYELIASQSGIDIDIIDAKRIAYAAKKFPEILSSIYKQYGITPNSEEKVLSKDDRMLYDFISFNSGTAEIKNHLIDSFIIHKIYEVEEISLADLLLACSTHYKSSDSSFFKRLIEKLKSDNKILETGDVNKTYQLSEEENNRINLVKEQFNILEQKLISDIDALLIKFNIEAKFSSQIIDKLRELFESNFNIDRQEILNKADTLNEEEGVQAFTKFYKFIKRFTNSSDKAKLLCRKLIDICKENDIIQKLSAGKLFTSFADPDIMKNYISQSERVIYLDTQIILYSLCYFYQDSDYSNVFFKSIKELWELRKKYEKIDYDLLVPYLNEVSYHLREALLLIPYEETGLLDGLGGSNNVFFNYYLYLKDSDQLDSSIDSLGDFIYEGFEINETDAFHKNFLEISNSLLKERLENEGVKIDGAKIDYDLTLKSTDAIQLCLEEKKRFRAPHSIQNDAKMLAVLFDADTSTNEPIFISWDQTMFAARKKFHELNRNSRLWHWFTPNQFITHISLLNFELDSSSITREVLSVLDDSFNLYKRSQQLLDTISKLLDVRSTTGLKYVKKIKEFRNQYIFEIDRDLQKEDLPTEEATYPIESLIITLTKHYTFHDEKYSLKEFKSLFTVETVFDKVIHYFKTQLEHLTKTQHQTQDSIDQLNKLIAEAQQTK